MLFNDKNFILPDPGKGLLPSLFITILLAFGCKVGSKYTEPALDLPAQYRNAAQVTDTMTMGNKSLHEKIFRGAKH